MPGPCAGTHQKRQKLNNGAAKKGGAQLGISSSSSAGATAFQTAEELAATSEEEEDSSEEFVMLEEEAKEEDDGDASKSRSDDSDRSKSGSAESTALQKVKLQLRRFRLPQLRGIARKRLAPLSRDLKSRIEAAHKADLAEMIAKHAVESQQHETFVVQLKETYRKLQAVDKAQRAAAQADFEARSKSAIEFMRTALALKADEYNATDTYLAVSEAEINSFRNVIQCMIQEFAGTVELQLDQLRPSQVGKSPAQAGATMMKCFQSLRKTSIEYAKKKCTNTNATVLTAWGVHANLFWLESEDRILSKLARGDLNAANLAAVELTHAEEERLYYVCGWCIGSAFKRFPSMGSAINKLVDTRKFDLYSPTLLRT